MLHIYVEHIGQGTYIARAEGDNVYDGRAYIADGADNAICGLIGMLRSLGYADGIIGHD